MSGLIDGQRRCANRSLFSTRWECGEQSPFSERAKFRLDFGLRFSRVLKKVSWAGNFFPLLGYSRVASDRSLDLVRCGTPRMAFPERSQTLRPELSSQEPQRSSGFACAPNCRPRKQT